MKRIEYARYGGPELMRIASFDRPAPGRGDVLVQVEAASINPVDWTIRRGRMRLLAGPSFPRAMGKDFSGKIVQIGAGVTGWNVGDMVLGCTTVKRAGAFASLALVRARDIVRMPDAMSFAQAATLPTVGLTAWHALVKQAKLKAGQSLLVNGAAGGVGSAAVQIAQSLGVRVTARVGNRSFERMKAMGADPVLDYQKPLPTALDQSFDVVLDCNGSMTARELDRMLKRGGIAVDITFRAPKLLRAIFLRRQKLASGSVDQRALVAVAELAAAGTLRPEIGAEVSLDEAISLITRLEEGEKLDGKAVIHFHHRG
ncbi:NADP-dependent oxidoreductase [Actinoplanes sp. M2I2]|uniref:NADP-dependent oxidoreductase n=1 Tax=Actinoplanes sp. M2I2 TaxID=1734444 RepID=UPI0020210C1C|nr:NADP-dependent oxidoreductase [Actinoplanes sp. M2I2]